MYRGMGVEAPAPFGRFRRRNKMVEKGRVVKFNLSDGDSLFEAHRHMAHRFDESIHWMKKIRRFAKEQRDGQ